MCWLCCWTLLTSIGCSACIRSCPVDLLEQPCPEYVKDLAVVHKAWSCTTLRSVAQCWVKWAQVLTMHA